MMKYHWNEVTKSLEDQSGRIVFTMHPLDKIQGEAIAAICNGGKTAHECEDEIEDSNRHATQEIENADELRREAEAKLDSLTEKYEDLKEEVRKGIVLLGDAVE